MGLWIAVVAAPSIALASGSKGCAQSCSASAGSPPSSGTLTTTCPGVGGQPGAFSGSATVAAPQEPVPATDFNNLTNTRNNIQSQIDALRGSLDNRNMTPADRLDLTHKLDNLLNNKNALQYVIDAANAASNVPGPEPPPPPPKDNNITNQDLANLGNLFRPGGPKPGGADDLKNKLDLVDGANALRALFGK